MNDISSHPACISPLEASFDCELVVVAWEPVSNLSISRGCHVSDVAEGVGRTCSTFNILNHCCIHSAQAFLGQCPKISACHVSSIGRVCPQDPFVDDEKALIQVLSTVSQHCKAVLFAPCKGKAGVSRTCQVKVPVPCWPLRLLRG